MNADSSFPPPDYTPANIPQRITRRGFFKRVLAYGAVPLIAGTYATQIEPFWPQFHELSIPIKNLPASFEGFRITQLTDLHTGRAPFRYIQRVIDRVKQISPDFVVVTGDLTHHNADWAAPISQLLATFAMPVVVTYGNHEYGVYREDETEDNDLPTKVQSAVLAAGLKLLRNASMTIDHADGKLWLVGLDDVWWGKFSPLEAFAGVPKDAAVIALSHNPDTAPALEAHRPSIIISGHTHGGQVRLPLIGAPYLNTYHRNWDQGMFRLKHTHLYVCRGVGYIHQIRFYCRPEIPTFKLVRA